MMEISKEELERFKIKLEEQQHLSRLTNQLNGRVKKLYEQGKIKSLTPLWHTDPIEINFEKQKDRLDDKLLAHGISIIENVEMEKLLDAMEDGNPLLFREKQLYHEDMIDTNISKVINHWQNREKLIPPTITLSDDFLTSTLKCPPVNAPKLYATDGKHRLNVAYFFGSLTIPILVLTPQLKHIKIKLGIS